MIRVISSSWFLRDILGSFMVGRMGYLTSLYWDVRTFSQTSRDIGGPDRDTMVLSHSASHRLVIVSHDIDALYRPLVSHYLVIFQGGLRSGLQRQ
jgi:hypothetical protein